MKNLILSAAFLVVATAYSATNYAHSTLNKDTLRHKDRAEKVRKSNMNMEIVYSTDVNAFCKLITTGDYDSVENMIKAGANINEKSVGMTPLMYAARYNRAPIVKLLIANGANLKLKSNKGYTALKYAKISNATDAYKVIEKALADQKAAKKAKRKQRKS